MKKVIAFDLDGTLSVSKGVASDKMVDLLGQLLDKFHVCIISGGKLEQFKKQLPFINTAGGYRLENMHLMPTCGTRYHVYDLPSKNWQKVYAEDFTANEKEKIMAAIKAGMDETSLWPKKQWGELIEDRGSQITISALGQEAPVDEKESWDPDDSKKYTLREAISKRIPEFEVRAGGTTSIDITKLGIDKAYGMNKLIDILGVSKDEILFMGDKIHEGGNDYPVKAMGIDSIQVKDWLETEAAIQAVLYMAE